MNTYSVPSTEQHHFSSASNERSAGADDARQPYPFSERLTRGFHRSIIAACTIPPLVFLVSLSPLNLDGTIIVTAWVALVLTYVLTTLARMRSDLRTGERKWNELRDNALALEAAYERGIDKYNDLYAAYIEQRGAVPLVAKRARGAAADSPSGGNGSAAVVPFTKTDGAA